MIDGLLLSSAPESLLDPRGNLLYGRGGGTEMFPVRWLFNFSVLPLMIIIIS